MIGRLVSVLLLACAAGGCACLNRNNTPLVNSVERHLVPRTKPAKIMVAPVVLPIGIGAGLLDVFIVHPISVIPDSAHDTVDCLWKDRSGGYVTRMGSTVPLAALTPIVFTGDFIGRSMFDIPPYDRGAVSRATRTADDALLAKMTADDICAALAKGNTQQVERWVRMTEVSPELNASEPMRVVLEQGPEKSWMRDHALLYLSRKRYEDNAVYLVGLLKAKKAGGLEDKLISNLAQRKNVELSHYLLDRLTGEALPPDQARTFIFHLFEIGWLEDVDKVLKRLRQPIVTPAGGTSE